MWLGSKLDLAVQVRHKDRWDTGSLTYALVSPPEGMSISPSGTITWEPTDEQVGTHSITIWLYDGDSSKTETIEITVAENGSGLLGILLSLITLSVGMLVTVLLIIVRRLRKNG